MTSERTLIYSKINPIRFDDDNYQHVRLLPKNKNSIKLQREARHEHISHSKRRIIIENSGVCIAATLFDMQSRYRSFLIITPQRSKIMESSAKRGARTEIVHRVCPCVYKRPVGGGKWGLVVCVGSAD